METANGKVDGKGKVNGRERKEDEHQRMLHGWDRMKSAEETSLTHLFV